MGLRLGSTKGRNSDEARRRRGGDEEGDAEQHGEHKEEDFAAGSWSGLGVLPHRRGGLGGGHVTSLVCAGRWLYLRKF